MEDSIIFIFFESFPIDAEKPAVDGFVIVYFAIVNLYTLWQGWASLTSIQYKKAFIYQKQRL